LEELELEEEEELEELEEEELEELEECILGSDRADVHREDNSAPSEVTAERTKSGLLEQAGGVTGEGLRIGYSS